MLLGQPGNQRGLEGIASPNRVRHDHLDRRGRPAAVLAAEHRGAVAAAGQEHQLATVLQPALQDAFRGFAGVEQVQVFVTDLDQVGMLDQLGHAGAPQLDIRLRVQAYVGVEADQALAAFPAYQGQQGVGNRLHHQ